MITHTVTLHEPEISLRSVRFSWDVDPAADLYLQTAFTLTFPGDVDVRRVPRALWWRIALACLYPHWVLLRPCRVVLPVRLSPGEREFWLRLCDAAVWALEARVEGTDTARTVDISESGGLIEWPTPAMAPTSLTAACFSGGRDSLTQLGLLRELGEPALLVTTNSPRPDSIEHESARRGTVMEEVVRRTGIELVEIRSDFRSICRNGFPDDRYGMSVTELTDCLLYFGAALAVASARGADRVVMASEAEVQATQRRDGMIVQHAHFMYSAVTQRALEAVIAPTGIRFGGLTAPLQQFQVQRLLALRYPDLSDLQYSCWELQDDEGACSTCDECMRIAMYLLSDDVSPSVASIDLTKMLLSRPDWLRAPAARDFGGPRLELRVESRHQRRRQFAAITVDRVAEHVGGNTEALAVFEDLRAAALADPDPIPLEPGYRAAYLELVDERLRPTITRIYGEYFARDDDEPGRAALARSVGLAEWINAPLRDPALDLRRGAGRRAPVRGLRSTPPNPPPLGPAEMARVLPELPDPEPPLGTAPTGRVLRVSDTDLRGNEDRYLQECIADNFVSSAGSFVARFEESFAAVAGTSNGIACSSGSAALQLAYAAAGIGPGDEVIMPAFTMIATANAASHLGARPVFVDTDPETWNMDVAAIADALSPRTRAIVVVHTYGQPADPAPLREIARRNQLLLIEDAAEAHGANAYGERIGSLGDVAAFSFYGNKILTTGEGGMVTTSNQDIAASARELRDHGFSPERHFWHRLRAYNFRMTNLQAAVGLAQVERLDELVETRRTIARGYRQALAGIPGLTLPPVQPEGLDSVHWMFGVVVGDSFGASRDQLRRHLATEGIETRTFFVPLHLQPAYLRDHRGGYPVAERLGRTGLYLPSGPSITPDDVSRVADSVRRLAGTSPSWP